MNLCKEKNSPGVLIQPSVFRRWGVNPSSSNINFEAPMTSTVPPKKKMVAQMVKNLPAMQENQVRSLGQEDPLENRMATHSSILA